MTKNQVKHEIEKRENLFNTFQMDFVFREILKKDFNDFPKFPNSNYYDKTWAEILNTYFCINLHKIGFLERIIFVRKFSM